jgi:hypothetical protein
MRPALVLPMHDPNGTVFPLLTTVTPTLKTIFDRAYLSVTPITQQRAGEQIAAVRNDPFFHLLAHTRDVTVGEDFHALYHHAATHAPPAQLLHLCFIDRVAYALQSTHCAQFITDIQHTSTAEAPLIFARSAAAWATHPSNYHLLESMVTDVGELLLGRRLDFCWCHVVLPGRVLAALVPQLQRRDLSICAELILRMIDQVQLRTVDWLAWEDPFVLNRDANELRQEREASQAEVIKRLSYVVPMLQLLQQSARAIPAKPL